jgi:mRNA-degrading endonuclease RelE of RelBE toxin-antitoxin system
MFSLPANLILARRAERDLDDLSDAEATRVLEDLGRLATRTFPGEIKPIRTLPGRPLQADAGRFRILFRWQQTKVEVIAVFPKSAQRKVFKGLK